MKRFQQAVRLAGEIPFDVSYKVQLIHVLGWLFSRIDALLFYPM